MSVLDLPPARTSAFDMVPFSNYGATTTPGAGNDSSQGYDAGSTWMNVNTLQIWRCLSATVGAAVWVGVEFLGSTPYNTGWIMPYRETLVSGSPPGSATLRIHPFILRSRCTIDKLACRVSTLSASGNVQLALYNKRSNSDLLPGTLIDKTGSITTAASATVSASLGANQQLWPGLYWAASQHDNATSATSTVGYNPAGELVGSATLTDVLSGNSAGLSGYAVTNTFGSWPGDLTNATLLPTNSGTQTAIGLDVVSSP